jgi:hypothetical protein
VGLAAAKRVQIRTCTKHLYRHQGAQSSRPPAYTNQRIGTRQLVDGYAECFGTELAAGIAYLFGGECKAVIYTHSGCTLEISLALSPWPLVQRLTLFSSYVYGEPVTEYTSEETAMGHYQSASILFEQMRVLSLATANGAPLDGLDPQNVPATPPHVLVLGPESSGKTTLCKMLVNYAVRGEPWGHEDWSPILVNVDPADVSDPRNIRLSSRLIVPSRVRGLFQVAFQLPLCLPRYLPRHPPVRWDCRPQLRQQFGPPTH